MQVLLIKLHICDESKLYVFALGKVRRANTLVKYMYKSMPTLW